MKATKIVCTLGPASSDPQVMREMLLAGMNVARMNFSHGSHEEHLERIRAFRQVCGELNLPPAILLDTKGPEIRLGTFAEDKVLLHRGQTFVLRQPSAGADAKAGESAHQLGAETAARSDTTEKQSDGVAARQPGSVTAPQPGAVPQPDAAATPQSGTASQSGAAVTPQPGAAVTPQPGSAEGVSISYGGLAAQVSIGTRILVDDGKIRMTVEEVRAGDIICRVEDDGWVSTKKGVNVPDIHLDMEFLSEKDKSDLLFGIEQDVDFVAASFVRTVEDVQDIRRFLHDNGGEKIRIISKIENPEGIRNFDAILEASDGIMIARGDMGVEVDYATLPGIQKSFIDKCNRKGKPVITATQMLESMINEPTPTRAEITDVANAVFDGTSAVMLSGESAAGQYPAQTVRVMARILEQAEKDLVAYPQRPKGTEAYLDYEPGEADVSTAIGHAACQAAEDIGAKALVAITCSGYTARMMSRFHPPQPIIAATPTARAAREMALIRGVTPVLTRQEDDFEHLVTAAVEGAKKLDFLAVGDRIVISAGLPLNVPGNTNMIRVKTV